MTITIVLILKATYDFAAFLRDHEHNVEDVEFDYGLTEGYGPTIHIDSETAFVGGSDNETVSGGLYLIRQDSPNGEADGQYLWELMHYNLGDLVTSELDHAAPMDQIYEFVKKCFEHTIQTP